jgi:hypothetical protein
MTRSRFESCQSEVALFRAAMAPVDAKELLEGPGVVPVTLPPTDAGLQLVMPDTSRRQRV